MSEVHDLSYLCERKYVLLAAMRERELTQSELTDLSEIEAHILQAQKQEGENKSEGWFDFLESRLKTAFKKFL